jgi:hypothetical protein
MHASALGTLSVLTLLLAAPTSDASAQVKASERGGVHQTVDGTTITLTYARPRARGRLPLFGGDVVHWDHVWTPGADWATTLEVDKAVTIQGTEVPVGKYSVWFVVQDTTSWEVWLEPEDSLFHLPEPERNDEQIHFWADVHERDSFLEVLTWSFADIRMTGTTLEMQWGTTFVPLEIGVEPSVDLAVAAEVAAPFVGSYEMTGEGDRPWWDRRIDVVYDSTRSWLLSTWTAVEKPKDDEGDDDSEAEEEEDDDDGPWEAALFPITDEWLTPGWIEDGELWSITKRMTLEFEFKDGRPTSFDLRNRNDDIVATATRVD